MKAFYSGTRRNSCIRREREGCLRVICVYKSRALIVVQREESTDRSDVFSIASSVSENSTNRIRKLLIKLPSTPVTNEGIISAGNDVAAVDF